MTGVPPAVEPGRFASRPGFFALGLTTPPAGHTLYDMSSLVAAATLGSLGIAVMWTDDLIADRLATQRVVRRCHYYAACAAILIAVAVGFVWLAGPNIGSGIWLANSALPGWKAWKHRNDDDRNDRLRRLWAKAKTSLPKPRLVPVRAIAVPT